MRNKPFNTSNARQWTNWQGLFYWPFGLLIVLVLWLLLGKWVAAGQLLAQPWTRWLAWICFFLAAVWLLALPSYTFEIDGQKCCLTIHTVFGSRQLTQVVNQDELAHCLRIEARQFDDSDGYALVIQLGQESVDFETFGHFESAAASRDQMLAALAADDAT